MNVVFEMVMLATLLIIGFSVAHHHLKKSLTFELFLEYILIAALAFIILQGILL